MALVRLPLLAFAFMVDRVTRLPGVAARTRYALWISLGLVTLALAAFVVWGLERAPQRVNLADLAAGALSPMQSWIIVSGELEPEPSRISTFRYRLSDPAVANVTMTVFSETEFPVGVMTTLSGTFLGPREPVPPGHRWIGQMRADSEQVQEQAPPWVAMALAAAAGLVGAAGRVSYPMFLAHSPRSAAPRAMTARVSVRRGRLMPAGPVLSGALVTQPGAPVTLSVSGAEARPLRLHSVHTGIDAGELRYIASAEPALRVRLANEEMTLAFAVPEERDVAHASLLADAAELSRHLAPRKYLTAE